MSKIGLFFGTDTGTTRLLGKKIAKKLGEDLVDKPLNINRASLDDLLSYQVLILGTATYGEGDLPGMENNVKAGSWAEFVPQLEGVDLTGKTIALYGVGSCTTSLKTRAPTLWAVGARMATPLPRQRRLLTASSLAWHWITSPRSSIPMHVLTVGWKW